MKRRMIALVLTTALMGSMVSGCGAADTAQEKTVDEETDRPTACLPGNSKKM